MTTEKHFTAPIAAQIWDMKYRLKEADGTAIDQSVEDTWWRIAQDLASVEREPHKWERKFYSALEDFKFIPAGRIVAGAGTKRDVTLFNCFVMGTIPDSMDGIFTMLREAALTMQQGGGIGYDFSTLRPKGALVKGVAADASGPLTFMDVWDSMCRTVMSAGSRRGAMMATMRCDHPDILDFIDAKKDPSRLRMFNLSVLVTDAFMKCLKEGGNWDLVFNGKHYTTIDANYLWDRIMESTFAQAEPGVIFIDRINQLNNLNYCETIASTNPCGEQPLPPYGACLLGSINLAKLVKQAFTSTAKLDVHELERLVTLAVRMMDNVVDASNFPLEQQKAEAQAKRRIGLGVTGLADALAMCGVRYGSTQAAELTSKWLGQLESSAYKTSIDLAKEKGPFPLFDYKGFVLPGSHASGMSNHVKSQLKKFGIRNALLTSIAPTGTISLYAGNVSSGIEPIFANSYTRKVLTPDGSKIEERVVDYAVDLWERLHPGQDLPDYFVTAQNLTPSEHVIMQSAAQRHVDSSISKTINCPEDISYEDFKQVYLMAWERGCKGCTTYRPNDVTGSVLSIDPEPTTQDTLYPDEPTQRPQVLDGKTYKLKYGPIQHAIYITITDVKEHGQVRPFEVFINSKSLEHYAWTVALTRMISAVFRRPQDSTFVVEELKAVFDPKGGAWMDGKYVPSVLAAIGGVIEQHMVSIGYMSQSQVTARVEDPEVTITTPELCPNCGSSNYVKQAGCAVCKDCGHSACG